MIKIVYLGLLKFKVNTFFLYQLNIYRTYLIKSILKLLI